MSDNVIYLMSDNCVSYTPIYDMNIQIIIQIMNIQIIVQIMNIQIIRFVDIVRKGFITFEFNAEFYCYCLYE